MTTETKPKKGKRNAEIKDILALGKMHNQRDFAEKAAGDGMPLETFRHKLMDKVGFDPLETPAGNVDVLDDMGPDGKGYSLLRAIALTANKQPLDGVELEASQELARRSGTAPRGFYMPHGALVKRDLTVGSDSAGGHLRGVTHMGDQFVEALRNHSAILGLNPITLHGLQGNVSIPAMNAKTAVQWVAENGAPTEGAPTYREISMSPKTVSAYVDFSRRLNVQSDPQIEQVLIRDVTAGIAAAIDDVAIEGGDSNQPTGITQTTGIGTVTEGSTDGGAPTWTSVLELIDAVEVVNGNINSTAFLTNTSVKKKLASTVRVASTDSRMILDEPFDKLAGERLVITNNTPSDLTLGSGTGLSAMIYGDFSQLILGFWGGGLDILVDPFSLSTTGGTRVTFFQDVDVAVRHAESFAVQLDINTT